MSSVVDLDRRAVEVSAGIAAHITPGQLTWPTPCAGWSLADLLSHMIAQVPSGARGGPGELPGGDAGRNGGADLYRAPVKVHHVAHPTHLPA